MLEGFRGLKDRNNKANPISTATVLTAAKSRSLL